MRDTGKSSSPPDPGAAVASPAEASASEAVRIESPNVPTGVVAEAHLRGLNGGVPLGRGFCSTLKIFGARWKDLVLG